MAYLINLRSFSDFVKSSSFGGLLLLSCVVISLFIANGSLAESFAAFLSQKLGVENEYIQLNYSLQSWINDGLMAIFFLLVGLEIKRELVEGELSSPKQALLPILAAIGGATLPAIIFYGFNHGLETQSGWGIPMATDIAFALAVIVMLGPRVPVSLKIFLAALAIVDDLLAILVVALFYTNELHFSYLFIALGIFGILLLFNKKGVKNIWAYLIPGIFMWYFIHHSGIHATIAGILTALALPTTIDDKESPLEKLERYLTKPVNFLIVPLFALTNTNITVYPEMAEGLFSPLGLGIIFGLIVGKSLGIFFTCFAAVKTKLCRLPEDATWKHIAGVGLLGGIGFTMSIFVSLLSFSEHTLVEEAKLAVLITSLSAGILGYTFLYVVSKREKRLSATAHIKISNKKL